MSSDLTNRRVVLASRPKGVPDASHFKVEDVPLRYLEDGELLVKCAYWSVDPAMRGWVNDTPNYLPPVRIGATMRAAAVGEIIASRTPSYAVGDTVSGKFGWQQFAICKPERVDRKITENDLSPSLALGILGLNGLTAYFGLLKVCAPEPGETVVVSTAAGAVGSAVSQIAKIRGCRTVGITSNHEKAALCRDKYGFDEVIIYRDEDVAARIKAICPDGINCYFDNTCGPISDAVMSNLALGARITVCGTASLQDWDPIPLGPRVNRQLLVARARMQGFLVTDHSAGYDDAIATLAGWIRSGQLAYSEHILHGADAARGAIKMLYEGRNTGKLLIRID